MHIPGFRLHRYWTGLAGGAASAWRSSRPAVKAPRPGSASAARKGRTRSLQIRLSISIKNCPLFRRSCVLIVLQFRPQWWAPPQASMATMRPRPGTSARNRSHATFFLKTADQSSRTPRNWKLLLPRSTPIMPVLSIAGSRALAGRHRRHGQLKLPRKRRRAQSDQRQRHRTAVSPA